MSNQSDAVLEALFEVLHSAEPATLITLNDQISAYKQAYPRSWASIVSDRFTARLFDTIDEAVALAKEQSK